MLLLGCEVVEQVVECGREGHLGPRQVGLARHRAGLGLALTALLSIIGGLKVFDLVFIMTRGGPTYSTEVLATMLYREAFELNHMGVASAIGVILVAVVLSIARVQTFVLRESREGEAA